MLNRRQLLKVAASTPVLCAIPAIAKVPAEPQPPVELRINPITEFRIVASPWYETAIYLNDAFYYGTDLSKYANDPAISDTKINFTKKYTGSLNLFSSNYFDGTSIVLMKAYLPVDIIQCRALPGEKSPIDELKIFKDGKEIFEFRHSINLANDRFDVKMTISNKERNWYSELIFSDVRIIGMVHKEK